MTKIENTDKILIRLNHNTYTCVSVTEIMPETLFDEAIRRYDSLKQEKNKDAKETLKKEYCLNENDLDEYNQIFDKYDDEQRILQNLKSNFIKLRTNNITDRAYEYALISLARDIFNISVRETTSIISEDTRNYKLKDYGVKAYAQELEDNQKRNLKNWKKSFRDKILNIDKFLKHLQTTAFERHDYQDKVIDNDRFRLQEGIIELRSDLQKILINFNEDSYFKDDMPDYAQELDYWIFVGNNRWISLIDPHWRYRKTKVDDARIKYEEAKEDYDDAVVELHRKVA